MKRGGRKCTGDRSILENTHEIANDGRPNPIKQTPVPVMGCLFSYPVRVASKSAAGALQPRSGGQAMRSGRVGSGRES